MSYDYWRANGSSSRCVCGERYTQADGEPCHWVCKKCDKINLIHDDTCVNCGSSIKQSGKF